MSFFFIFRLYTELIFFKLLVVTVIYGIFDDKLKDVFIWTILILHILDSVIIHIFIISAYDKCKDILFTIHGYSSIKVIWSLFLSFKHKSVNFGTNYNSSI